jgi:hypothetical protein
MALLCTVALGIAVLSIGACRRGVPVIDPGQPPPTVDGTISGTIRGPEGTSSIADRQVTVTNVETGDRQSITTNNAGGFTFKVKPGRYRVSVALAEGETVLKEPGIMHINKSDVDAHADFIIGRGKQSRSRRPMGTTDITLGPPIT